MQDKFPMYVKEMIDDGVSRVKNVRFDGTVSFAFINDTHNCTVCTERAMYAISEINKKIPIEFTCIGGDYLCNNSRTTHDEALAQHNELADIIKKYGQNPVCMVIKGNHDDNHFGKPENVLHPDEIYDTLMSHHAENFVSDEEVPKAMYGYYDMPDVKLRAIYLNVFDPVYAKDGDGFAHEGKRETVIGNRQLNWLAKKALMLPQNDWDVVLFSHASPVLPPFPVKEHFFGGDALLEILIAFKEGGKYSAKAQKGKLFYDVECDFTKQGPCEIIGIICGHHHRDWVWNVSGIPFVSQIAAASDNFDAGICSDGTKHHKTRGSGEESAFTVFTINRALRRVSCIRFGAGSDFRYEY